jgi:hypothetical protein
MGYQDRALKAACKRCQKEVAWLWQGDQKKAPPSWLCKCGWRNFLIKSPDWPDLPRTLYLGHELNRRLRVYPSPPQNQSPVWAQPYSIRSFLLQASENLGGCSYSCSTRGVVMDEAIFSDTCCAPEDQEEQWQQHWDCHIAGGWTNGQSTCPLWEKLAKLCQTDPERRFLHQYLSYTKHRQFPMLLPQTWIGIADRKRPDFVAFVPLQYWNYKWIAIQLDGAHSEDQEQTDKQRDAYVVEQGYEVLSIRPSQSGYFEEVRRLVEGFENRMNSAKEQLWQIAIEAEVSRAQFEEPGPDDLPF